MAYDIGTARGVIEIGYDGKGVAQAKAGLADVDKRGKGVSASMEQTGRMAGRAGLVIAGGLAAGVAVAANFEQRMSAIKAVSGATENQMGKLSDKALQLGKDTAFSAGESAQAMEELIKAGLSVGDVLNGAADATVALAAAGEIDLPQAATIASNSMNQFNLAAEDMKGVVDTIAGAANSSAIDVSDFGQSLQQVGAVANLAGVDFDDTATAIALLGNAGIKGSDAGTSLKSMFMRLQPTTDKQASTMRELGLLTYDLADANESLAKITGGPAKKSIEGVQAALGKYVEEQKGGTVGTVKNQKAVDALLSKYGGLNNAFYDAEGNTKSLSEVSGLLNKSLRGMSKEQKQARLNTLFGSDAIRAAAILTQNGAKGFDKMAASIAKTDAAKVAATRLDNFKGSLEQLKGSLETLGITMGTILLPMIRTVVDKLTGLVNWFTNLSPGVQQAIVAFLAIIATGLLLFAAFIKIAKGIMVISQALNIVKLAMASTWVAALGPIALVIAIIAALVVAFVILWKKSEAFRNFWKGIWDKIKAVAQAVAKWFTGTIIPSFNQAWNQLKTGLNAIKSTWITVWNGIKTFFSGVWNLIKGIINIALGLITGDVGRFGHGIVQVLKGAWDVATAAIRTAWELMRKIAGDKINAMMDRVEQIPSDVKNALGDLGSLLLHAGADIIQGLIDGINSKIDDVKGVLGGITKLIPHVKGPPAKDKTLLYQSGIWIMEGFNNGLLAGAKKTVITLHGITKGLFDGLPRDVGPLESDVASDIKALMTRIEDEYGKRADAASKRIAQRFAKTRRDLEKDLKAARDTKGKADDKALEADLKALDKREADAIKKSVTRYKNLTATAKAAVRTITAALVENANQQDKNNEKLEEARGILIALQDEASNFADAISDAFTKAGDVVGLGVRTIGEETTTTSADLLADLADKVAKARHFAQVIAGLVSAGLNQATIQELLAAGVEGGMATAEAIASGGVGAVEQINSLTGELTDLGAQMGGSLAKTYYGQGIAAAHAVVDGLVIDQATLVSAAEKLEADLGAALGDKAHKAGKHGGRRAIDGLVEGLANDGKVTDAGKQVAKTLVRAFKDELGIHSPSKVAHALGLNVTNTFAMGIMAAERQVIRAALGVGAAAAAALGNAGLRAAVGASASPLAVGGPLGPATLPTGLAPRPITASAPTAQVIPDIRVFIGDTEIKDNIRIVVGETLAPLEAMARQGAL